MRVKNLLGFCVLHQFFQDSFSFYLKIEACKPSAQLCKDEFLAFENGYENHKTCEIGAIAEVISSPPGPKAGILCHCAKSAGSLSTAEPK